MNWDLAIRQNREALVRFVAFLYACIGVPVGGSVDTLPRCVRAAANTLLRPAESALRRLLMALARDIIVKLGAVRAMPKGIARAASERLATFPLLDRMKRFGSGRRRGVMPRISMPGVNDPVFAPEPNAHDPICAKALCRRLDAVRRALEDLPKQALRLARWQARRNRNRHEKPMAPGRLGPRRPGWPPGHRRRGQHPIHALLAECDALARMVPEPRDSS